MSPQWLGYGAPGSEQSEQSSIAGVWGPGSEQSEQSSIAGVWFPALCDFFAEKGHSFPPLVGYGAPGSEQSEQSSIAGVWGGAPTAEQCEANLPLVGLIQSYQLMHC